MDKLLAEGHIRRVETVSDEVFIQTVVINVKKDKSVKVTLDDRSLNKAIQPEGKVSNTKLGQFNGTRGRNYYCKRRKNSDVHVAGFVVRIWTNRTAPRISEALHSAEEERVKTPDEKRIQLKFETCKFAQEQTEWPGFTLSQKGIKPIYEKIQAITYRIKVKKLKELRSFMGASNQMNRFIPNLGTIMHTTTTPTEQGRRFNWKENHDGAFEERKKTIQVVRDIQHSKKNQLMRIVCDASIEGVGAENKWVVTAAEDRNRLEGSPLCFMILDHL